MDSDLHQIGEHEYERHRLNPIVELAFSDLSFGDVWGESITNVRASELDTILQKWRQEKEQGGSKGPFASSLLTGADVFWLAAQMVGTPDRLYAAYVDVGLRFLLSLEDLHLEGASLRDAHLEGASLRDAHLESAHLDGAHLEDAFLRDAHLEGAHFGDAHLEGAHLDGAHLEGAHLGGAHLEGAHLDGAHLEGAMLWAAHLESANLQRVHLEGMRVPAGDAERMRWWQDMRFPDEVPPADVRQAFFNSATNLNGARLGSEQMGYVPVADVRWDNVNLAVLDWTKIEPGFLRFRKRIEAIELGDEREANKKRGSDGTLKDRATRLQEYKEAVRANRQLAIALRGQGLNEDADRYAYKAQRLQRRVLRRQRRYLAAGGSWLLDAIAGYGYKPLRSLYIYAAIIAIFAALYWCVTNDVSLTHGLFTHALNLLGMTPPPPAQQHLQGYEAIVVSITSFHGRGFFQPLGSPGDRVAILSAGEAVIGLFIEITFIATFTQRFFAK